MSRGTARIAVVGDTHVPFMVPKAFDWACNQIKAFKPTHIIHLGDLFEADAASIHGNEYSHDLHDEYAAAAEALQRLEASAPEAQLYWLLGNHDDNIQAADSRRVAKSIRRAAHWSRSREFGPTFDRWRQVPYEFSPKGALQIGQTFFYHDFNGNWDMNLIRVNNLLGGHAHRLGVFGHHHKVIPPTQAMRTKSIPLPLWGASPGTLGPLKPDWTRRQDTSHWGHGIAFVEALKGRACQPAKNWSCEVLSYPGAKS
jgi:predicted phosphodiesterase